MGHGTLATVAYASSDHKQRRLGAVIQSEHEHLDCPLCHLGGVITPMLLLPGIGQVQKNTFRSGRWPLTQFAEPKVLFHVCHSCSPSEKLGTGRASMTIDRFDETEGARWEAVFA